MSAMSVLPDEIDSYLASTRLILPKQWHGITESEAVASEELMYKPAMNYIDGLSRDIGIDVKFKIVFSDSMKSEAIVFGDYKYVVHDRYLGQTLNMLNRLFLYGASLKTRIIYFHKIASQLFSRYGFYEEAVFAAQFYQRHKTQMDHVKKQRRRGRRPIHWSYTHVQELHIILHEYCHLVFKENPELLESYKDDVRGWVTQYGSREVDPLTLVGLLLGKNLRRSERQLYIENVGKLVSAGKWTEKFAQEIAGRDDLIEEFCCDRLAVQYLVPYVRGIKWSSAEASKAIILGFLHLRAIQLLEARCSFENVINFEERKNRFEMTEHLYATFYNARLHYVKELSYNLLMDNGEGVVDLHKVISEMMADHSDHILTPGEALIERLMYDADLRELMAEEFEFIQRNLRDDQMVKRFASGLLHAVSEDVVGAPKRSWWKFWA